MPDRNHKPRPALLAQLLWFVRLRWIAGLAVVVGGLLESTWLGRQARSTEILLLGLVILLYNCVIWTVLRRARTNAFSRAVLYAIAWAQITLDLTALATLTAWTGGSHSPLTGLFVLHMVFASLLLTRTMAYAGALLAMALMSAGLIVTAQWPTQHEEALHLFGWAGALLLTVYVANHLTRSLRHKSRRLARQNRRIIRMSRALRRHQRRMVQHEKMIAMGQMAAGVAHEIANPLASMDSLLQLTLRKPERLNLDTVQTLREQVARIHQIVQHMTSFAHPAEGQWQIISVNDVVAEALRMLNLDARLRGADVDLLLAPDIGVLRAMPHALQQVIVNLVLNALDAMADVPHPRLLIRTQREDADCRIDITDNGHGIAPEHLARLFEPFFTTKPVGKGTGLGLSISYSLIRRHGGQITVRSDPGQGSTFTILLPLQPQPALSKAGMGHR